jgi:hypothetical protein
VVLLGGGAVVLARGGGPGSHAVAAGSTVPTGAPTVPPTAPPTTQPAPTTTTEPDPQFLPQTPDGPSVTSARFTAGANALWRAIVDDDPEVAMPFFFPLGAYEQVKAISQATWVQPGAEYNKGSYWRVYNAQLRYTVDGQTGAFPVASMISWRGEWYVVHLNSIR